MKYMKPQVAIYDEEVMQKLEAAAGYTCNCTSSGSKITREFEELYSL